MTVGLRKNPFEFRFRNQANGNCPERVQKPEQTGLVMATGYLPGGVTKPLDILEAGQKILRQNPLLALRIHLYQISSGKKVRTILPPNSLPLGPMGTATDPCNTRSWARSFCVTS